MSNNFCWQIVKQKNILLIGFLLSVNISFAQITYEERLEFPMYGSQTGFKVVPVNDTHLFMFRDLKILNKNFIELHLLDRNFEEVWSGYISTNEGFFLADYDVFNTTVALLLRPLGYYQSNMMIININSLTGEYLTYNVDNPLPIRQWAFRVKQDGALIGGYYIDRPLVYYFSFETFKSRILPGFVNEPGEINQVEVYGDGTFEVIISGKYVDKSRVLWIKSFASDGTLIKNNIIRPESKNSLLFGRSIITTENNQIIVGSFGSRSQEFSHGIFTGFNDSKGIIELKYYNYGDLNNFFNYMRTKKRDRVKERISRKKIKGKRVKFRYRLSIQEVIENQDEYIMVGQAFYPIYISTPHNSELFFAGNRYTHAVIIGLDKSGNLLWDNSFETNEITSIDLKQYVQTHINEENNTKTLLFMYDNVVRTKVIEGDSILTNKRQTSVPLSNKDDIIVRSGSNKSGGLAHWYDDYYIAYGAQTIKNKLFEGNKYRTVFFINKISVD